MIGATGGYLTSEREGEDEPRLKATNSTPARREGEQKGEDGAGIERGHSDDDVQSTSSSASTRQSDSASINVGTANPPIPITQFVPSCAPFGLGPWRMVLSVAPLRACADLPRVR